MSKVNAHCVIGTAFAFHRKNQRVSKHARFCTAPVEYVEMSRINHTNLHHHTRVRQPPYRNKDAQFGTLSLRIDRPARLELADQKLPSVCQKNSTRLCRSRTRKSIQERSGRRGRYSSSHLPCRKVPKNLGNDSMSENWARIYPQRRNLLETPFSKDSRTAKAFSSQVLPRGLLQGRPLQRPMGWGVGEELTKS